MPQAVLATGQTLAIGAKLIRLINQYPFRQPIASIRFQPMAKKSPPTPEVNSPATEPSDTLLSQLIGYALRRAQLKVAQNLVEQLNPFDLRPAQFSALLPGSLKALFAGEHLLLRSLASNGRVVMLLIVDQNGGAISDSQLQVFSKTAQCIERALTSFARRGA